MPLIDMFTALFFGSSRKVFYKFILTDEPRLRITADGVFEG